LLQRIPRGKILRIILAADANVVWSADEWTNTDTMETTRNAPLNLWFADLPTADFAPGSSLEFTLFWKGDERWQGRNWQIEIT